MSLRPKVTTTTTAPVARKTHAVSRAVTSPQGLFPWRPVDVGNSSDAEDVESFPAVASASLSNRKKNKPMAPPHWIPLSPSRENSNSSTVNWTEPLEEYTSGSEPFIYDLDLGDDPFSLFQYDSSYSLDEGLALAASGPQNLSHAGTGVSTEGPGRVTVSDPVTAMGGGEHLHNQSEPSLPPEALAGGALTEAGREARTGEQGVLVAAHSSWAQIPPFSTTPERTGVQTDQARPGSGFSEQTAERTTQSLSNIATQSPSLLTVAKLCFSERVRITTDNDPTVAVSIPKDYTPTPSPISIPTTSAMPYSLWTAVITEIQAPNSLPTTPTIPLPTAPHPAFSPSSVHSMEQSDVSHSRHVRPAATETETSLPPMEVQRQDLMREGTRPRPLSLSVAIDAATALTPILEKTYLSSSDKHHRDLVLPSLRNQLSSSLTNSHPVDGMVPSESIASESGSQSEWISLYSPLALEPSSYMSSVLGSSEGQEGFNPLSSNLRGFSRTSHLSVTPITEQLHHQALLPATVTDEWTFSQSSPPNTISPSRQEWRDALRTTFSLVSLSSDLLSVTDLPEQLNINTVTEWESADGMERHSARQEGEEVHMSPISGSASSPSLISLLCPSTQSEPSVSQLGHRGTSHINDDGSEDLSQASLHLYSSLLAPSRPLALPTPLISSTASEYDSVVTHEPKRHAYMHELGWKRLVSGIGIVIHTDTHTPVSEPLSTMTSRADQLMPDASEALLFHRPMTTNPPRISEERLLPASTPTPLPTHIPPLSGTLSAGAANMADSGAGASLPTRSTAAFQQSSTLIGSQSKPTQPAGTDGTLAWHGESRESTVSPAAPDTQLTASASSNPTIRAAIIQPTAVTRNTPPPSASNIQLTTANKQPTVFPNIQSTSTSNSQPPMALNTYLAGAGPLSVPWRANHSKDTQDGKHGPALIDHTPSTAASTSLSSMGPGNNVTVNQNTNTDRETETQTTPNPLAVIGMDEQSFVATKGPYLPLTTPLRGVNAGSDTVSTTHATPRTSAGTAGTPVIAPCQCKARFHLSCLCGLSTGNSMFCNNNVDVETKR
ncbi:mucin-2-like [Oncorhynchus masou masou]|uniref:mucin-2-like n=1 Tax=Oncorhynchus masou masou TaxID=90313 RepID=UPI00318418F2